MAQNTIADLSGTFSSNTDFLGQSMQGSATANTIDTIFQKFAALLARFYGDLGGTGTVGGTANAITYTSGSTYTSLATGLVIAFKATSSISGAATFKLDSLAAKDIKLANDTDVTTGNIVQKQAYLLRYDAALDGGTGAWALLNPSPPPDTIIFVIDGGATAITTGVKGDLAIPFSCTITEWSLLADQSGSIVVDIWKDTYANFPPVVGDTITASAKPTISASTKGQSSTLTGWTTAIGAGDILRFNVDSVTSIKRLTISLKVSRLS